jgi:diacylglycerol kinase (ATP)
MTGSTPATSASRLAGLRASFRYAFAGLARLVKTQRNAQIHAAATVLVIVMGLVLHLGPLDWAFIVFAIGLVWTAEALNTALEASIDLASPGEHPLARIGKDVGAGAVLLAAITAAVIGLLVLGPPLLTLLSGAR